MRPRVSSLSASPACCGTAATYAPAVATTCVPPPVVAPNAARLSPRHVTNGKRPPKQGNETGTQLLRIARVAPTAPAFHYPYVPNPRLRRIECTVVVDHGGPPRRNGIERGSAAA